MIKLFKEKIYKVLIVDDERKDRILLIEKLNEISNCKFIVHQANSVKMARKFVEDLYCDIIFLDFLLDDGDGLQFLTDMPIDQKEKVHTIFTTAYGNKMVEADSMAIGADSFLKKEEIFTEKFDKVIKTATD